MTASISYCEYEVSVEKATHLNEWTDELLLHLKHCPSCSNIVVTIQQLEKLADKTFALTPRLSPQISLLWARLEKRAEAVRRQRFFAGVGMGVCAIASTAGLILSNFYELPQIGQPVLPFASEVLRELLSGSWSIYFLLATLATTWIILESGISERA